MHTGPKAYAGGRVGAAQPVRETTVTAALGLDIHPLAGQQQLGSGTYADLCHDPAAMDLHRLFRDAERFRDDFVGCAANYAAHYLQFAWRERRHARADRCDFVGFGAHFPVLCQRRPVPRRRRIAQTSGTRIRNTTRFCQRRSSL